MNDYAFGNFLYSLRMVKGLYQAQLGELLGVTNKAVSKWENGSAKPNTALIPRIAEILGVTVEELFACKRFDKDREHERAGRYLSALKRKYAFLSSAFFAAALVVLPLLFIAFFSIITGFDLQDNDVLGVVGVFVFIFLYIVSITAFVIYKLNFRYAFTPTEMTYTPEFVGLVKKGMVASLVAWGVLFELMAPAYWLFFYCCSNAYASDICLAILSVLLIFLFGAFVCFINAKRLLGIHFSDYAPEERKRFCFDELSKGKKIGFILAIVLLTLYLPIRLLATFQIALLMIRYVFRIVWLVVGLPLILRSIKKTNKK